MRIINHYFIPFDFEIYQELLRNNCKVEVLEMPFAKDMAFDICCDEYNESLVKKIPFSPTCSWLSFSTEELNRAEWLVMYPRSPKLESKDKGTLEFSCLIKKNVDSFIQEGAYHHRQIAPFAFSSIKWTKNNHLYSAYEGDNFVFCDELLKNYIEREGLCGITFEPVIRWKDGDVMPNAFQLQITNTLSSEALIIPESTKRTFCPMCGREKYEIDSKFILRIKEKYLDKSIDFYKTAEIFGPGRERSLWIVSARAYSLLTSKQLARGFAFEPVQI